MHATGTPTVAEVVQLCVTDDQAAVSLPYIRLRGVRGVHLEDGQRAAVTFEIKAGRSSTDIRRRATLRVV